MTMTYKALQVEHTSGNATMIPFINHNSFICFILLVRGILQWKLFCQCLQHVVKLLLIPFVYPVHQVATDGR